MIYDLTLPIDEKTPTFADDPKQKIEQFKTIDNDGFNEKRFTFNTHFSTHIDFPVHMLQDGKTSSEFPIDKFVGECVILDARDKNIDEINLDQVKEGDFIFLCTGHIAKIYSDDFFDGAPTISKEMAYRLIEKKVSIIGLDSFTPDYEPYDIHKILLKEEILIVENLVGLDKLVDKRFKCIIAPLKISGSDGSPCRVIAILD